MRRLLTFTCEGTELGGSLDAAEGAVGLLMVTGGSQTRVGSHRMYERLAKGLSERGFSCLRFDRRGAGDSAGADPGFRGSAPDIAAAAAALRREAPSVRRAYGFGLCDGATALALFGAEAGLDGLLLVNPWLVEAEAGDPAAAAVKAHYRQRLTSLGGWKRLLTGGVDYRKLARGIGKVARGDGDASLAADVAASLNRGRLPVQLVLAVGDNTAIAAEHEINSKDFKGLLDEPQKIDTDSHTFARPGDEAALLEAATEALRRLEAAVKPPGGS
ncbi:MAG TPA: hydrolase 1, exosortase A system-associated [Allosphingosinicella sp.]|jgi:exosortase A-associated hydrolase 1